MRSGIGLKEFIDIGGGEILHTAPSPSNSVDNLFPATPGEAFNECRSFSDTHMASHGYSMLPSSGVVEEEVD